MRTRSTARLVLAGLGVLAALVHVSARSATAQDTAVTAAAATARVPAVTLEDALRRAEGDSPSVVAAFEDANRAAAELASARSMSWRWNDPFAFGPQSSAIQGARAVVARARADEQ